MKLFRRAIDDDQGKKPIIVIYNRFFGNPVNIPALDCGDTCVFTNDRRQIGRAAAVVFHIPDFRRLRRWRWLRRLRKRPGQLWVAWSMESEVNYPMLANRDTMARFDLTMTYRRSADIWCPYLPWKSEFEQALETPVADKTAGAAAVLFQSAPYDRSGRNGYAGELMAHMDVHSYGKFLNNRQIGTEDRGGETKRQIISAYKFCLAFENSIAPDYVTEKFFDPLRAGTVPVYRGAPNIDDFAPGDHAFIDASKFAGPRELAACMSALDQDDAAYRAYFRWRENGFSASYRTLQSNYSVAPFRRLSEIVCAAQAAR
ncbi:MAG: glycosyltransferase family 10 domain-containing protein [Alphaproteobacteria bacterium]